MLCGALFLDGLDVSMVGVALPSIGADLGLATGDLQWVVSGYVLGYGGLLLLGGRTAGAQQSAVDLRRLRRDRLLGRADLRISVAMLVLVRTVVTAPEAGWGAPDVIGGFVVSALLLAGFVAVERRVAHPLVRLGILRSGPARAREPRRRGGLRLLRRVPVHRDGLASGLVNTSFQVGGAVVLAVAAAVVSARAGHSADPHTLLDAYRPALGVVAGLAGVGLIVALSGIVQRPLVSAPAKACPET